MDTGMDLDAPGDLNFDPLDPSLPAPAQQDSSGQLAACPVQMGLSERESFRHRLIGKERLLRTSVLQTCFKKPLSHQFCADVEAHRISDLTMQLS
ncbi:hypothetical protein HPB52_007292 [Rhipicephalus sanguineus]|uniref:Uncharacterized protein n=1 Tax=Rhipicephalus sanguineus TaxID=34632 RepID=A0A9D4QH78_RHISA|nr:hypothetical protein HPB52_007292 [Rhipicephalus sanguineus]